MKIVTINIPDQYLDALAVLVEMGFYPSRSEAVRQALKQFLTKEIQIKEDLEQVQFRQLKSSQMRVMMNLGGS